MNLQFFWYKLKEHLTCINQVSEDLKIGNWSLTSSLSNYSCNIVERWEVEPTGRADWKSREMKDADMKRKSSTNKGNTSSPRRGLRVRIFPHTRRVCVCVWEREREREREFQRWREREFQRWNLHGNPLLSILIFQRWNLHRNPYLDLLRDGRRVITSNLIKIVLPCFRYPILYSVGISRFVYFMLFTI